MQNAPSTHQRSFHDHRSHARAVLVALLIGASYTNLDAATFSDDNWTGLGGYPGANGPVYATVVDGSGNLYIGGAFSIAGGVFATNIAKWDGTSWSALGSGMDHYVTALVVSGNDVYAAGRFITAGGVSANSIAKWNGTNWSPLGSGLIGGICCSPQIGGAYAGYVYSLAVSGNDVYASGAFTNAGGNPVNNIAKWDGSTWSALGSGLNSGAASLAVSGSDLYVGGGFTNAGGITVNRIAKWNGSSWSPLGSGVQGIDYLGNPYASVSALAVSGNNLYVAGSFSTAGVVAATNMAKWNGSSWSAFPWPIYSVSEPTIGGSVGDLAISGNDLYAAGDIEFDLGGGASTFGTYVMKWNGSSWSALEPEIGWAWDPYDEPHVNALTVSGTHVYAGGEFRWAGGVTAHCIAKWNGSNWSAVSSGTFAVTALAGSGNEVYAAGHFGAGLGYDSIAKWNGSSWSPLGSATNYNVTVLAASGGEVYAAGNFTNLGITANIARWNGSSWSAVGSGVGRTDGYTPTVTALTASGSELYVAGWFTTAGGVAATNIAKWNGTNWFGVGWAVSNYWPVWALAVSGNNLYAGGTFSTADGSPGNYIAKWNGSSWSPVGSGVDGYVTALAVLGSDLYAGGWFKNAGGINAQCVAKWDGSNWSGLDSGITRDDWDDSGEHHTTPYVYALAISGNDLYMGGLFNTAGDEAANYIAKWNGSSWSALGSGMNRGVDSLAASGSELFASGSFTTAGGKLSPYLARARVGSTARSVTASNSTASIRLSGVTGYPYDVQRATSLTPPIAWTTVSTVPLYPADDGSFTFTDTNATSGSAFYRLRKP